MKKDIEPKTQTLTGEVLNKEDYIELLKKYSLASRSYRDKITPETATALLNIKLSILNSFPFSPQALVIKMWPEALEVLRRESSRKIE